LTTVGNIEAQARPLADRLGGEERLKQPRLNLRRDTRTAVSELDQRVVALTARGNDKVATALHGVDRIVDNIGPYLIELAAVRLKTGQASIVFASYCDRLDEPVARRLVHIGVRLERLDHVGNVRCAPGGILQQRVQFNRRRATGC